MRQFTVSTCALLCAATAAHATIIFNSLASNGTIPGFDYAFAVQGVAAAPEPAAWTLLALGLLGLGLRQSTRKCRVETGAR